MFLFDNAHRCTNIVLGSKDAFLKTLEWYMTRSTLGKSVVGDSQDERRKLLMNLAALLKSLGSTLEPVWTEGTAHAMPEFDKVNAFQRSLRTVLTDWLFSSKKEQQESLPPPQEPKTAYITLAGSFEPLPEDMAHSQRMLKKRIKIDVESQGRPEAIRAQARERLIEEYLTYPSRTLYLFSKRVRMMILGQENEGYLHSATASALPRPKDPEDIIAQALHNKMVPEKLNRLLYKTTMNDIDRTNYPISENELWKTPTPSLEGALRLQMIRKFVFDLPGLLKECGIAEIERLALSQELKIRQQNLNKIKGLPYPFIDDDQKIELLTRVMAKPMFREALEGTVEATMLDKLEDVIFKTSYPSPPIKPPI
ncbi:hypothetical protein NUW58_g5626 [Xylaria curta]|uniref:Uncharacterized protein n=1 Tax=Xylaria curta TaxID=42375 RepID=A0ACC1P0U5_9PEZI|nr:hypothetical protein NUW58_g5626 [Xylaria curta]